MTHSNKPLISDHAVIRFCERAKNIDMEWIRDHILTDDLRAAIACGAKTYRADGLVYVIRGGQVKTIKPETNRSRYIPTRRQRKRAHND